MVANESCMGNKLTQRMFWDLGSGEQGKLATWPGTTFTIPFILTTGKERESKQVLYNIWMCLSPTKLRSLQPGKPPQVCCRAPLYVPPQRRILCCC